MGLAAMLRTEMSTAQFSALFVENIQTKRDDSPIAQAEPCESHDSPYAAGFICLLPYYAV